MALIGLGMQLSLRKFIAGVVVFGLMSGVIDAATKTKHRRFSIAISGGASKGAYEAGFNWSVLKLARDAESLQTLKGGQVLPFKAASFAGASAGGINTLLSGLTWCSLPDIEGGISSRSNNNVFRDIWLRIDINTLLPKSADSTRYLPDDAVLSRKDFIDASGELRDKWQKPVFRKGCRVPLGVTVTRIVPDELKVGDVDVQNQRFYIPFELRVEADKRVGFYFDPADYPQLADPAMILLPRPRNAPPFSIEDKRVEAAAFTTSAFPTAFGRKRLQYCRLILQEIDEETEPRKPEAAQVDTELNCPDGYELAEAEFADGGLFDNLPVGLARILAEFNERAQAEPLPVTYIYLDPNRRRYRIPTPKKDLACDRPNPPAACATMEFSFFSESELLIGFLGTARRYELYRELTDENWQLKLSELSYKLADMLRQQKTTPDCQTALPYFEQRLDCDEVLRLAGRLLEIAYVRARPMIQAPYSADRLRQAGIASNCRQVPTGAVSQTRTECKVDIPRYRNQLADGLKSIAKQAKLTTKKIYTDIDKSRSRIQNDRILRVSSRGAPITGTLLEDFGSFLDYKFREYDYYVGVYDAVIMATKTLCGLQFSTTHQVKRHRQCFDGLSNQFYRILELNKDPRGRYVFARLAEREYGKEKLLNFAYASNPEVDRDMQIIHEGLAKALAEGELESTFFQFLKAEGFVPTPTKEGKQPLLARIIDDPDSWATELTRRVTARLVYLEKQAKEIYAAREPDPAKRETANTKLMGATAYLLQGATYRYPRFSFAPSTAPDTWVWRNIIPFSMGIDITEGDVLFTWQPTLALSSKDLVGIRASLGFTGGVFESNANEKRENYLGLGLDYTRLTSSLVVSSFGLTPTWYHTWVTPSQVDQDTLGGDVHASFLKNRLRISLGTRDFSNTSNTWFITVDITDIPGLVYWLTR